MRSITLRASLAVCVLPFLASVAVASFMTDKTKQVISQKGRSFGPSAVYVRIDEDLYIQNDDDNLVHDAYVDSPDFSFESGDINPGATAVIAFPKEGDFLILCGIHPSMKLVVHVQSSTGQQSR